MADNFILEKLHDQKTFRRLAGRQASKEFIIDVSVTNFRDLFCCSSFYKIVGLSKRCKQRRKRIAVDFNGSEVED